eukprot:15453281-Alexandrium_andersonii.AAC.1
MNGPWPWRILAGWPPPCKIVEVTCHTQDNFLVRWVHEVHDPDTKLTTTPTRRRAAAQLRKATR